MDIRDCDESVRDLIQQIRNENKTLDSNLFPNDKSNINVKMAFNQNLFKEKCRHGEEITHVPILTLFTTWQTKAEKYDCHNNTVNNWLSFGPDVIPILFTNETNLSMRVKKADWKVLPIKRAFKGIPILKNMFLDAMKEVSSLFYAYSNGDILFTNQLIESLKAILVSRFVNLSNPVMVVGRRTNVIDITRKEASSWDNITNTANARGKLFIADAEDFFITTKVYPWKEVPDLIIGRNAYDNWLVLNSRKRKFTTIDITATSYAVHQTTKAGNFEGHHQKDKYYNHNLLKRLYTRIHYGAGLTFCTDKITKIDTKRQIYVVNRNIPKSCFPT
ncbi:hypothetical protein FSP39_022943 [Pinctada imbricata]|uniref:Uncharacterized protein n=1 Tax=Pinctada imbricata TaxID=66713 RepID=A0AA88XGN0_PINIB|nr:hypothetical protein FSP39_022943 [Pinctada imbricata]